jgi:hypothetical protein
VAKARRRWRRNAGATMTDNHSGASFSGSSTSSVDAKVLRGQLSWTYFYVAWGFLISIEGTFIAMWEPLKFPSNIVAYIIAIAATTWLLFFNPSVKNKLIALKNWYENIPH